MARQKKDGEKISLYVDKEILERLRTYASEKGQTLTMALERAVKAFLDSEEGNENGIK